MPIYSTLVVWRSNLVIKIQNTKFSTYCGIHLMGSNFQQHWMKRMTSCLSLVLGLWECWWLMTLNKNWKIRSQIMKKSWKNNRKSKCFDGGKWYLLKILIIFSFVQGSLNNSFRCFADLKTLRQRFETLIVLIFDNFKTKDILYLYLSLFL